MLHKGDGAREKIVKGDELKKIYEFLKSFRIFQYYSLILRQIVKC